MLQSLLQSEENKSEEISGRPGDSCKALCSAKKAQNNDPRLSMICYVLESAEPIRQQREHKLANKASPWGFIDITNDAVGPKREGVRTERNH